MPGSYAIGTCSWNYDSWVGLVYSKPSPRSADYLPEYARRFRTAEIDSFFYRLPESRDVLDYLGAVDEDFTFTVKVSEDICLTHRRRRGAGPLEPNPHFLSPELFAAYLDRLGPMLPRVEALMLEFEYLNRDKMRDLDAFLRALEVFTEAAPPGLPLAIETRNKGYLTREYFQFLREKGLIHVFSEKLYMPPVHEVYERFGDLVSGTTVIRLLGGDRAEIEERSGGRWDRIIEPKADKAKIADLAGHLVYLGGRVIINVNNHYEGSAPLTAAYFEDALGRAGGEPS